MQLLDNRYRDYVGFPPLLRSGENDGKSFSDFYRASQIELFSALDNVLSQKAEDTLNQFAAVKKAEVNFQTSLGNRKGQLGINLIGAFAERQNNAFGWQVRVYGAQQDGKGFNAGVFYRHITDIALFGANAFVDYENHKLGNFYRYSIGGEAQNQYGSFAVNYYVPITDEKRKDGGGVIFSRKGYDAKLRLNIPNAKFLKAAVDYYNFGDEHGAESDDGFRYGAEAHLIPGLRIALLYDNGEKELGGEVFYAHTIGEVQQAQTANEQWTPDLFAAVSREHSQRIVSVNVVPPVPPIPPSPVFSAITNLAIVNTPATIGAINIFAGYFNGTITMINPLSPNLITASNGTLIWQQPVRGLQTLRVEVSDTPPSQTATLAIAITGYAEVGRVANVNATMRLIAPASDTNIVVSLVDKLLLTIPPASAMPPFVITITQVMNEITGTILEISVQDRGGVARIGDDNHLGNFLGFIRAITATLSVVLPVVSADIQSTIYEGVAGMTITIPAQSAMSFDMPGFFPPSFPQIAKLALAENRLNAMSIPPHYRLMRRKGFVANPPPLIF